MRPQTTFANGVNPFLNIANPGAPAVNAIKKSIPAKPAKRKLKDEDYSTPYFPPAPPEAPVTAPDHIVGADKMAGVPVLPAYLLDIGITLTDDPLPGDRRMPGGKYNALFAQLPYGKRIKCQPGDVVKICIALRKYVTTTKRPGLVRSVKRHPKDGLGGVWLMGEAA